MVAPSGEIFTKLGSMFVATVATGSHTLAPKFFWR